MDTIEYDWAAERTHLFREGEQWFSWKQCQEIRKAAREWARANGRTVRTGIDPQWARKGSRVLRVSFLGRRKAEQEQYAQEMGLVA